MLLGGALCGRCMFAAWLNEHIGPRVLVEHVRGGGHGIQDTLTACLTWAQTASVVVDVITRLLMPSAINDCLPLLPQCSH